MGTVYGEVRKTLIRLRQRGYLLAIGSSSRNAGYILQRLGLADFFDAVSDGTNLTRSKPDPEVFLTAACRLGLRPEACLVVEDAWAGIEAARRGGFDSAGLGAAAAAEQATFSLPCFAALNKIVT